MKDPRPPAFPCLAPAGYAWLLDRGWVGFEPFTGLQPWHYVEADSWFSVKERWPHGPSDRELVLFARRQDNDDLACFELGREGVERVVVIHGWTSSGYDIGSVHASFWDWLKASIDDVAEWCASDPEAQQ